MERRRLCGFRAGLVAAAGLAGAGLTGPLSTALAAEEAGLCAEGAAEARIACLSERVAALTAKLQALESALDDKADRYHADLPGHKSEDDIVRYSNGVTIQNQDMHVVPRCIDNPGPQDRKISTQLTAEPCGRTSRQVWFLLRPKEGE